ncbi:hypothetical protein GY50_1416 [Dehalococcoides mccartyi GY50]|jgi:hypothetical protein|nr:hypothetical protein GY50_1416 [Dehalococcoides mccartyi GY50]
MFTSSNGYLAGTVFNSAFVFCHLLSVFKPQQMKVFLDMGKDIKLRSE